MAEGGGGQSVGKVYVDVVPRYAGGGAEIGQRIGQEVNAGMGAGSAARPGGGGGRIHDSALIANEAADARLRAGPGRGRDVYISTLESLGGEFGGTAGLNAQTRAMNMRAADAKSASLRAAAIERENFQADIASMSPSGQHAALMARSGQVGDPLEAARLRKQAGRLTPKVGMNRQVMTTGMMMTAMFGGWEAMSGLNAFARAGSAIDPEDSFKAYSAAMDKITSGPLGSWLGMMPNFQDDRASADLMFGSAQAQDKATASRGAFQDLVRGVGSQSTLAGLSGASRERERASQENESRKRDIRLAADKAVNDRRDAQKSDRALIEGDYRRERGIEFRQAAAEERPYDMRAVEAKRVAALSGLDAQLLAARRGVEGQGMSESDNIYRQQIREINAVELGRAGGLAADLAYKNRIASGTGSATARRSAMRQKLAFEGAVAFGAALDPLSQMEAAQTLSANLSLHDAESARVDRAQGWSNFTALQSNISGMVGGMGVTNALLGRNPDEARRRSLSATQHARRTANPMFGFLTGAMDAGENALLEQDISDEKTTRREFMRNRLRVSSILAHDAGPMGQANATLAGMVGSSRLEAIGLGQRGMFSEARSALAIGRNNLTAFQNAYMGNIGAQSVEDINSVNLGGGMTTDLSKIISAVEKAKAELEAANSKLDQIESNTRGGPRAS